MADLAVPTVHLNGTSREELVLQWENASAFLRVAMEGLQDAAPNARDYYPQGPGVFDRAVREHGNRMERVRSVLNEIHAIWKKTIYG